jgi:hypothetical protein
VLQVALLQKTHRLVALQGEAERCHKSVPIGQQV